MDNRMSWVRNLEKINTNEKAAYFSEHEIATECHIAGLFDYAEGNILCGGMSAGSKDKNGLYHYLIRIKHQGFEPPYYNKLASQGGYYLEGGPLAELLSLFSLYFQCRFYLVASYSGELTRHGLKIKIDHDFLYKKINPTIHPKIFDNRRKNFAVGLKDFLDSIKNIDANKHQNIMLACYHYARSLKEVGIDSEMVFIRLVSAVEILSKDYQLDKKDKPLVEVSYTKIFNNTSLSELQEQQLKNILKIDGKGKITMEQSKLKFIRFIEKYSKGYFKGGNWKAKHVKITRNQLNRTLKAIYSARSDYLHNGNPMYLSQFMRDAQKWDTDPTLGMIIDNRSFPVSKKLPYTYWFEDLVRFCLLNYLKDISK